MAILNRPSGDQNYYDFIRHFRPAGSDTIVWAQNMTNGRMYHLLRWGNEVYLPVADGDKVGIGIYNGSGVWRAYPIYIEGRNLWDGGPAQPEDCDPNHMWELMPWQHMVADKLVNPDAQSGRPLIITATGFGETVGEASFHTTEYRGQIRVYERLQLGGGYQRDRRTNEGSGRLGVRGVFRGSVASEEFESFGPSPISKGESTRGSGQASYSLNRDIQHGRAGIGAGAEEYQGHHDTGIKYQHNAQPVVFLRIEYRADLLPLLNSVWGANWDWFWPMPHNPIGWWDDPWTWRTSRPVAPEIPVIRPHNPRS